MAACSRRRRSQRNESDGCLDSYLGSFPYQSRLNQEEERGLAWQWINDGDESARNALVERNLPFVVYVAKRYLGRGLAIDELVAEGNIGLIQAATTYDPARGARFLTFAKLWITQAIRGAVRKSYARRCATLDEASLASPESSNGAEAHDLAAFVTRAIEQVTNRQCYRDILKHRLGLYCGESWSLRATGEAVGLSDERVRQVEQEYLRRIREAIERAGYGLRE